MVHLKKTGRLNFHVEWDDGRVWYIVMAAEYLSRIGNLKKSCVI